jgi:putative ABC transport system substrate-binding protein
LFVGLAARYQLPALYTRSQIVKAGGLMSYIFDGPEQFRQAATYLDRILKGANPGDLPIQLPTKFELTINLKTAKGLGLTVPPSLLATADEVIE